MKNRKKYLCNKADRLLQEYIKAKHKRCLVCEAPIFAGHHFITKGNSNALRYYLPNIIPICKRCHCKVHTQPHLVEPTICFIMGQGWYDDLIKVKMQGVKANIGWYEFRIEELQELLDNT